ncbi:nucleoside-binding protein [Pseudoalteromonas byunsanensis]|uniref:Nucleoside-binding protein n=1 Tax=Pseudoalteromonas byunsanensis TaxID=327939 RepID=A0A1S1N8V2_9GAMM|nr:nucleoside-binding protein [Pseudoalteromonas byunsanensis]OHU95938.1 nucleoside-binding protein [Pseudoalteromonas byunsanensis]
MNYKTLLGSVGLILFLFSSVLYAANWSKTQLHINRGKLTQPFSKQESITDIISLQHASAHDFGDVFFFIDYLDDDHTDGFNDGDIYTEAYVTFSTKALFDWNYTFWRLKDVGFILGVNAGDDTKVMKYLPGIKLSWDIPGFKFLTTTFTGYFDDNAGLSKHGVPQTNNTFMLDLAWGYPYQLGSEKFYFTGHAEYIGSRRDETGRYVNDWILAQMAFQWDLGNALGNKSDTLMLGIEWQVWRNKLGTSVNESSPQLHLVWTF